VECEVIPCHGFLGICVEAGVIVCGLSWLYWLREIGLDVNKTLPQDQRVRWSLTEKVPAGRMHWRWREHAKLFPESRKRIFAGLSILLCFLIPIAALIICLLNGGVP
jgi:hypothetical protein